jgi:hypothetical protein
MIINYNEVCESIVNGGAIKATKYITPKFIIRATRKLFGKKITKGNIEMIITIGKPNYAEREFIKLCQEANEPFPVKKVQLKIYNPKKNKLKGRSK